jgi:amidophosphoribosyltransferase
MCAITGVILKKPAPSAARMIIRQLLTLQTRGGESCGLAYSDGVRIHTEKGMGTVEQVMTEKTIAEIEKKKPVIIIGHNRYSTTGGSSLVNAHPFWLEVSSGRVALAVNGNIPNAKENMQLMEKNGAIFYTESDTEYMLKYIF